MPRQHKYEELSMSPEEKSKVRSPSLKQHGRKRLCQQNPQLNINLESWKTFSSQMGMVFWIETLHILLKAHERVTNREAGRQKKEKIKIRKRNGRGKKGQL